MFEALPDSPLTMGDLVGRSFRAFRLRMPFFFSIFFWPCVISSATMSGVKWCAAHWLQAHSLSLQVFLIHWAGIFAFLIVLMFAQWELSLRSLAVVRLLMQPTSTYDDCLKYARRRKWSVLTIYNAAVFLPVLALVFWAALIAGSIYLCHSGALVGKVLCGVAVAVEAGLMTLTFCWSILATSLSFSILACEDLKLGELMARTKDLTMRYLWRGGSFFCLLGLALIAVAVSLDMPILIASLIEAATKGQNLANATYQTPIYLEIVGAVWESVLNIVLLAVALLADGLYYNDLRLRSEGLDILNKLGQLKAQLLA